MDQTSKLQLEIVTPEKIAYSEKADKVTLATVEGEITILPGHTSLVTSLLSGELSLKRGDQNIILATGGGFAEIHNDKVSVVTDIAERPEEIDEKKAEEARKRAEDALKEKERLSEEEYAFTAATLEKALAQLKVKRKHTRSRRVQ